MARILVIDDDPQIRSMLKQMLERLGHLVETAGDGRQGLKQFHAQPAELVICDILMPEKEGIQTIIELHRDFPGVGILAISGGGAIGPEIYLAMARELGANRVLSKPFTMNQLDEAVVALLGFRST